MSGILCGGNGCAQAWSAIAASFIARPAQLTKHVEAFCAACDADEVVLFEKVRRPRAPAYTAQVPRSALQKAGKGARDMRARIEVS